MTKIKIDKLEKTVNKLICTYLFNSAWQKIKTLVKVFSVDKAKGKITYNVVVGDGAGQMFVSYYDTNYVADIFVYTESEKQQAIKRHGLTFIQSPELAYSI